MTKRLLADVLWEAANVHLSSAWFSCIAVKLAYAAMTGTEYDSSLDHCSLRLLKRLGCDPHKTSGFASSSDPLGDRYMWLLLAAKVAEEEGIEV